VSSFFGRGGGGVRTPRSDAGGPLSGLGLRLPGGLGLFGGTIAPVLAVLGLVVIAIVSVDLMNGQLPSIVGGPQGSGGGPVKTPTPSNVVVIDPRANVPGSILYAKAGNIWVQTGDKVTQLTTGGQDSQPTWAPDGSAIYFIRTMPAPGRFIVNGLVKDFDLQIPTLERMAPDGSGLKAILEGRYAIGSYLWSYFIQQPSISADGRTAAIVTDGPVPTRSDIRVKFVNLTTGAITDPRLAELGGLGQQDPAFSPDGKSIVFTKNAREGARGAATIVRYTLASKASRALTGPGYIEAAWSPDGRYIAATKSSSNGTDIVLIDARSGAEVLRLTNDASSFAPAWSPAGDAIIFQRIDRGVIDLWLVKLAGSAPSWTVGDPFALTVSAGLDGGSRESWFIPPDQLPKPTPTPTSSAGPTAIPASPSPS